MMISNFTTLLTLALSAYVLFLIIHNSFGLQEGFQDPQANDQEDLLLRKPLENDVSFLGSTNTNRFVRPYDLEKKSILKSSDTNLNKYLSKKKENLEGFNFLFAGRHSQVDSVGTSSKNKKMQLRTEPPNPRLDQDPWTSKKINLDWSQRENVSN